jgi:hypothetical protein
MLRAIFDLVRSAARAVSSLFRGRARLAVENLALRQQVLVLHRQKPRPRLTSIDRVFWVALSKVFSGWEKWVALVKPETVIRWHRKGFRLFWRWKSRRRLGRPSVEREIRRLIRKMAKENQWGAPRIHAELEKRGYDVSQATVSRHMPRGGKRAKGSQTWLTFLRNHVGEMVSIDFFTVPTIWFKNLYAFIILSHERRRVVHFGVTTNPTSDWAANQVTGAFPWDTAPRFMIRDGDSIFDAYFQRRVGNMGIEEVVTAPKSPWQNPYAERMIGSIRRDCLDHVIVLGEKHLRQLLTDYLRYYHEDRCHLGLDKDAPDGCEVTPEPEGGGEVVGLPRVGGLHHRYVWQKAA